MPSFFVGKRFFLTYPRSSFEFNEYFDFVQSIAPIKSIIFGRELHEDGEPHRHVCIEFVEDIRGNERQFDFQGRHPNVQSPRQWKRCKSYCKKDGDYVVWPQEEENESEISVSLSSLAGTMNELEFFEYCAKKKISFQYAKFFWDKCHDFVSIEEDTRIDGNMTSCLRTFCWNSDIMKTIVLIGPSGCGKTTWAKLNVPKPALFCSHIDQLKLFRPSYHVSIIFDDVSFCHYPRESQIHIVDFENPRAIHCRHTTATIPAGVFKCFTANFDPLTLGDPAIRRRVKVYKIREENMFES